MVDVRVREQHPIDGCGIDGEPVPVALPEFARAFEEPAIDQQPFAFRFNQIFRTCYRTCRAEKSYFGHKRDILFALANRASTFSSAGAFEGDVRQASPRQFVGRCAKKDKMKFGGADGIRTHDLLDAIEARSQLRHGPTVEGVSIL